nr:hypothetical protein [candidate division Zixibacteria bacterium]
MSKTNIFGLVAVVILLGFPAGETWAEWSVDLESGVAFTGYNDVRIPGRGGTNISLSDDLNSDAAGFIRVRLTGDLSERQKLSLLLAPLRLKASGTVDRDIDFNGTRFDSGLPINSHYRFDSYRLTYQYALVNSDRLRFGLGLTAKIRDASIKLTNTAGSSEKTNTGFVPLINFSLDWSLGSNIGLLLEGDALAAPQGRAEDVLLAVHGRASNRLAFKLGYRILEGGVDNDEVYNFTLIHYLSAGVVVTI